MKKIKVAVVGANGYAGGETVRLLARHPSIEFTALTSRQFAGKNIAEVFPALRGILDMPLVEPDVDEISKNSDAVFLAIPHTQAMPMVGGLIERGARLIDHSADFRLRDATTYEKWYKADHTEAGLLGQSVYGLPELHSDEIRDAQLVAAPGCYPTGAILALAPAITHKLIDPGSIVISSMSGVSGAGQKPTQRTHYPEIADNLCAYGVTVHRHTPEIEQELSLLAGETLNVLFTPHLVPVNRGILTNATAHALSETTAEKLTAIYEEFYNDAPFVRVCEPGSYPEVRFVRGSNYCDIGLAYDGRTSKFIAISAIDNLYKGAAGQAVQCMNIMFGFPEHSGLDSIGLTP
jgi:N-acetyl-gamma-glutamyl-phosphate reductase